MKLICNLAHLTHAERRGAIAVGNFDGVHRGHAQIIARLVFTARAMGAPAVVFTFDPHPVKLLRPDKCPPPLTWLDRKVQLLGELGVDAVFVYPTDHKLLEMTPQRFFDRLLVGELQAKALVEGRNFFFGHNREGNVQKLSEMATAAGIPLEIVEPVEVDGAPVSSSRIRALVTAGDVAEAANMLTQPHRIRGLVVPGAKRGASLGFPTANLAQIEAMLPALGVYAGAAHLGDSAWPAAINLGPNPTFGENAVKVEAHLIGFGGELYGQRLEVEFFARLREIYSFKDVQALRDQLRLDVAATERHFQVRERAQS